MYPPAITYISKQSLNFYVTLDIRVIAGGYINVRRKAP